VVDDHDPHRVGSVGTGQDPGDFEAVAAGHPYVGEYDVGSQQAGPFDRGDAVGCFADHP
jgi:hypothetical protein